MKQFCQRLVCCGSLTIVALVCSSCGKKSIAVDVTWSIPVAITQSQSGLDETHLFRWQDDLLFVIWDQYYLLNSADGRGPNWKQVNLSGIPPQGYLIGQPGIDGSGSRIFYSGGIMENDQLEMSVLLGTINRIGVQIAAETKWTVSKTSLIGPSGPTVRLNNPGKRRPAGLGGDAICGSDLLIPYCLSAITVTTHTEEGPFNNGVFRSVDAGKTWRMERIANNQAFNPSVFRSSGYDYYFAASLAGSRGPGFELWSSRKAVDGGSWDKPSVASAHFCDSGLYQVYSAVTESDAIHVCWVDRRHEKRRISMDPQRRNYEIAYRCRKDSDADWRKDVIISKGVFYSYAPSMSVESNRVVIAWSGIDNDEDWHGEHSPNDVFYATSKDGGSTWLQPVKVTNSATNGITSGRPQVMLLNGTIHLFYIQGERQSKEISPGLTKLNQPPWPIYYTQRPFPK